MKTWYKISTTNGWRIFPQEISKQYVHSISSKPEERLKTLQETKEIFLDCPGMVMADRSIQSFYFYGLKVSIPSHDFGLFLENLEEQDIEIGRNGVEMYKLKGWLEGLVLTPQLRQDLLEKMCEIYPEAEKLADQENAEFCRRIKDAQNKGAKVISLKAEMLKKKDGKLQN